MISATQARILVALAGGEELVYTPPELDGDPGAFGWALHRPEGARERVSGTAVLGLERRGLLEREASVCDPDLVRGALTGAGQLEADRLREELAA